ncbi:DUF6527 family protein [Pseudomonas aeruginosa]|uniref:DUF6527 family protein n=1 Tax=Pseudomonas aeruginosa TaxID=287 RepID=UPI001E3A0FDC|nr:DUF6527 family protein [Pseudomonas aeruginosa]
MGYRLRWPKKNLTHCPGWVDHYRDVLEVALIKGARQRWSLSVDGKGRPTLYPSIWRTTGCRSHFWVRKGRIHWCGKAD